MKIIYYLKNLKITKIVLEFLNKRLQGLNKFFKKEEALVEVELSKDEETRAKSGLYKTKIILDLPKKSLIVAQGVGKNVFQAINDGLKKLKRQLRRKP
jgi:ribosomal subunit interface protein